MVRAGYLCVRFEEIYDVITNNFEVAIGNHLFGLFSYIEDKGVNGFGDGLFSLVFKVLDEVQADFVPGKEKGRIEYLMC